MVSAEEERPFLFSPVTEIPEWRLLESHQGTITRAQFEDRWRRIYDPAGVLAKYIRLTDEGVELFRDTAKTSHSFICALLPERVARRGDFPWPLGRPKSPCWEK